MKWSRVMSEFKSIISIGRLSYSIRFCCWQFYLHSPILLMKAPIIVKIPDFFHFVCIGRVQILYAHWELLFAYELEMYISFEVTMFYLPSFSMLPCETDIEGNYQKPCWYGLKKHTTCFRKLIILLSVAAARSMHKIIVEHGIFC